MSEQDDQQNRDGHSAFHQDDPFGLEKQLREYDERIRDSGAHDELQDNINDQLVTNQPGDFNLDDFLAEDQNQAQSAATNNGYQQTNNPFIPDHGYQQTNAPVIPNHGYGSNNAQHVQSIHSGQPNQGWGNSNPPHRSNQYNSGQYNSGQYNSGQHNSGQHSSGQYNNGQYNSGQMLPPSLPSMPHNSSQPYGSTNLPPGLYWSHEHNQNGQHAQRHLYEGIPGASIYADRGVQYPLPYFANPDQGRTPQQTIQATPRDHQAFRYGRLQQGMMEEIARAKMESYQRHSAAESLPSGNNQSQPQDRGLQQRMLPRLPGPTVLSTTQGPAVASMPVNKGSRESLDSSSSSSKAPQKTPGQRTSGQKSSAPKAGSNDSTPASKNSSSRKRTRKNGSGGSQPEQNTPTQQPRPTPSVGAAEGNGLPKHITRRASARTTKPIDDRETPTKSSAARATKAAATTARRTQDERDRESERDDFLLVVSRPASKERDDEIIARFLAIFEDTEKYIDEATSRSKTKKKEED